jgi:hypothetical protein
VHRVRQRQVANALRQRASIPPSALCRCRDESERKPHRSAPTSVITPFARSVARGLLCAIERMARDRSVDRSAWAAGGSGNWCECVTTAHHTFTLHDDARSIELAAYVLFDTTVQAASYRSTAAHRGRRLAGERDRATQERRTRPTAQRNKWCYNIRP